MTSSSDLQCERKLLQPVSVNDFERQYQEQHQKPAGGGHWPKQREIDVRVEPGTVENGRLGV